MKVFDSEVNCHIVKGATFADVFNQVKETQEALLDPDSGAYDPGFSVFTAEVEHAIENLENVINNLSINKDVEYKSALYCILSIAGLQIFNSATVTGAEFLKKHQMKVIMDKLGDGLPPELKELIMGDNAEG